MGILLCIVLSLIPGLGEAEDVVPGKVLTELQVEQAVLRLSGASCLEELDSDEYERCLYYLEHPLALNLAPRSKLLSSGLLTVYRVASLEDYRRRNGDVLSYTELATLDGFGEDFVTALRPFVSLASSRSPGQGTTEGHGIEHTATFRSSWKRNPSDDWALSARYGIAVDGRYEAGIALKEGYGDKSFPPRTSSFHLSYEGRRYLSKLVIGAFNCRFGQGLCMWTGFSTSTLAKASSASRNPTLVAPYRGFDAFSSSSTALLGAAASVSFGGPRSTAVLSAFVAHPGIGGANCSIYTYHGQFGFTAWCSASSVTASASSPYASSVLFGDIKASADFRYNIRGVDIFGEAAFDFISMRPAALCGVRMSPFSGATAALLLRYYPSDWSSTYSSAVRSAGNCRDEHALTLLSDIYSDNRRHLVNLGIDAVYRPSKTGLTFPQGVQIKGVCLWNASCGSGVSVASRAELRYRSWETPSYRSEVRSDLSYDDGTNSLRVRLDAVYCSDVSYLAYADAGRKFVFGRGTVLSLNLRQGAFHADLWADRIYCSNRDVPGSFNVSAMYGYGIWSSMLACLKLPVGIKLHLYGNLLLYPRSGVCYEINKDRVGKFEMRLQLQVDLWKHYLRPG